MGARRAAGGPERGRGVEAPKGSGVDKKLICTRHHLKCTINQDIPGGWVAEQERESSSSAAKDTIYIQHENLVVGQ